MSLLQEQMKGKLLIILADSEHAKDMSFLGINYLDIETGRFLIGQRRNRSEGMEVENICDQRSTEIEDVRSNLAGKPCNKHSIVVSERQLAFCSSSDQAVRREFIV